MRAQVSNVAVAVFFAGLLLAGNAAAAETLRLGGTGSAIEMLRQVGAQFTAATGVKIDVVFSLGSTGAIRALADGVLDIAGEPLAGPVQEPQPGADGHQRACDIRSCGRPAGAGDH